MSVLKRFKAKQSKATRFELDERPKEIQSKAKRFELVPADKRIGKCSYELSSAKELIKKHQADQKD